MVREGYKETELGEIPEEWAIITLENSCEIFDHLRIPLKSAERIEIQGIYPYYGANGILGHIDRYIFDGDYILLAEDGGYFDEYEDRPIAQLVSGKFWVNNHAHILRPNPSISIKLLYYSLVHKNILFFIQGGTRSKLNQSELKSITTVKPPLPEQHRIATVLSTIDACIEKTEALIAKLKSVKAGLMQDLLTRGIDDEGRIRTENTHEFKDTEIGRVPVEWEISPIENTLSRIIDYRGKSPEKTESGILLITARNVREGILSYEEREFINPDNYDSWMTRGIPEPGSVLFTTEAPLGNVAILPKGKFALAQRILALCPNNSIIYNFYLLYLALSPLFKRELNKYGTGSTVSGIKQSTFRKIQIPVPIVTEQLKISSVLIDIDNRINHEETFLDKLLLQKKGLMADLLTGKVRVPDTITPTT